MSSRAAGNVRTGATKAPPHKPGTDAIAHANILPSAYALARMVSSDRGVRPTDVSGMHRSLGNRAVSRLLRDAPRAGVGDQSRTSSSTSRTGVQRTSSSTPHIQRQLTIGGKPVNSQKDLSDEQINQIIVALGIDRGELLASIDLVFGQGVDGTTIVDLINSIAEMFGITPEGGDAEIDADVGDDDVGTSQIATGAKKQKGAQGKALLNFLGENTGLESSIETNKLTVKFGAAPQGLGAEYRAGDGFGGTAYFGGSKALEKDPQRWMRIVLHELGHGTFQQILMKGRLDKRSAAEAGMDKEQTELKAAEAALQQAQVTSAEARKRLWKAKRAPINLTERQAAGQGRGGHIAVLGEPANVQQTQADILAADQNVTACTLRLNVATANIHEKLTKDGSRFFQAWLVLRSNNGETCWASIWEIQVVQTFGSHTRQTHSPSFVLNRLCTSR